MRILTIRDFCYISDGNYSSKYPRSDEFVSVGIPFIRANNLVNGTVVPDDMYYISPDKHAELRKGHLQEGDVLITTRGNIGQTAIVPVKFHDANINAQIVLLRVDRNIAIPQYLAYALHSESVEDQIRRSTTGTALKQLPVGKLENIKVKIHPYSEQQRIVTVMHQVDELIYARRKQLAKLEQLVKSRFIELFDSIENCKISKFSDECEEITAGGDRPKDTSEIRTEDYPYPVFANAATNEGLLCFSREYKIEKPCVTIAARGCTVGFTAIRYEKFTPVVRLISLVPKETVTPIYLKYYIDIKMNIEGNGAAQPQLTIPMIKSMEIMVPPIELQNQFAAFVEQTDKSKLAIQQSLDKLELLKKSLMQEYFG